jgi:hypothetical protein
MASLVDKFKSDCAVSSPDIELLLLTALQLIGYGLNSIWLKTNRAAVPTTAAPLITVVTHSNHNWRCR